MRHTIYVLNYDYPMFTTFELFKSKEDRHHIQYRNKWYDLYTTKYWYLEELVWEYQYWDETLKVSLVETTINI